MKLKKIFLGAITLFLSTTTLVNTYAANPCFSYWYEYNSLDEQLYYLSYDSESLYNNSTSIPVSEIEKKNILYINGSIEPNSHVVIKNNRSLIPLRSISEKLGCNVNWNAASKEISIEKDNKKALFTINQLLANNNGTLVTLDAAPEIISGITYVPVRAVAHCLGAKIDYYSINNTYFPLAIISIEIDTTKLITQLRALLKS